jgi:hypothetical protein
VGPMEGGHSGWSLIRVGIWLESWGVAMAYGRGENLGHERLRKVT